ncbi:MAG TPA: hypothetical protein PKZ07_14670 [Sedimentisphaerales bacterium]|nr:hypothetical protein [Sedimentisphaerales bacterium]
MAETTTYKFWKEMPIWAKGVIGTAIAGSVVVAAWSIWSMVKRRRDQEKNRALLSQVRKDLAALSKKGIEPGYSQGQYKIWADSLQECFQGWGTCNNYLDIFKMIRNDADLLLLIDAYGIRKVSGGKLNPVDQEGTLPQAMVDELDANEIFVVNQVLAKNGVKTSIA